MALRFFRCLGNALVDDTGLISGQLFVSVWYRKLFFSRKVNLWRWLCLIVSWQPCRFNLLLASSG